MFRRLDKSRGPVLPADVIAIDGETVRKSHDHADDRATIPMVSTRASAERLVRASVYVDDNSNVIIPLRAR